MQPITALTKKNMLFEWSQECQQSFDKLKAILVSRPVLRYPRLRERLYLATDASLTGLGVCLMQIHPDTQTFMPIAYYARALNRYEMNYGANKLELLAVVNAVQYFKVYLQDS